MVSKYLLQFQVVWKFKTKPSFIQTQKKISVIITSDSAIFLNSSGDIANVNINTGELIWFLPTQNTLVAHETNFLENSDIVLYKGSIYFSTNFSKTFSLDLRTGVINWINNLNSNLRPVLIDNLLFTISKEGYLVIVDSNSGKIIRSNYILNKFKEKKRKKFIIQGFLIASNKIFITTNLGYLLICSIETGKVEKLIKVDKSLLSEPLIVNNNLYILSDDSVNIY